MRAMHFVGETYIIGPPKGHDPARDGEVYELPVAAMLDTDGRQIGWEAVWKPDAADLARIVAGGGVRVRWMGGVAPHDVDSVDAGVLLFPAHVPA